jgi:hypothetical protein
MQIKELVSLQQYWESRRGINNGHFNIPRIRDEIDEAEAEQDPLKVLGELIDVIIITAGGLAKALEETGQTNLDELIMAKIRLNNLKYPIYLFDEMGAELAIPYCREIWRSSLHNHELSSELDHFDGFEDMSTGLET